ncbi:hypothetical protein [Oryzicola mucosus]|nr:hypothetical protein [Oryzicola mucosus]
MSIDKNVRVIPNYLNYQMWKLGEDTSAHPGIESREAQRGVSR